MINISITNEYNEENEWCETISGWSFKQDYVCVIDSKFINRMMLSDQTGILFIVAENSVALPSTNRSELVEYINGFTNIIEGDGVLVHWSKNGLLTVYRTAHATVPIYVSGELNKFCAGWDFNSVISRRDSSTLSRTELRRLIQFGPELSQDTIAVNVKLLLPGQKAIWGLGSDQIEIKNCYKFDYYEQSTLVAGATLSSIFVDLIKASSTDLLSEAQVPTIELSGGMDSSCVAVALHNADNPLYSYGLIHRGNAGDQQVARRNELKQRLKIIDSQVESTVCKPFTSLEHAPLDADFIISPYDELYWDGIVECINSMPNGKPDLIVTGIGGDELTISTNCDDDTQMPVCRSKVFQAMFFRDLIAARHVPKTFVSQSALAAAFVRARMFLHNNIWPKNPLIDPRVVQFCQMIPPEHKQYRLLNKLTLARAGLSDYFIVPRFKENFSRVFMDDLLDFRSDNYFSDSLLHTEMIANSTVISNEIKNIQNGGKSDLPDYAIISAVRLEYILRYYVENFSISFTD